MKDDDLSIIQSDAGLVADVRSMIEQTREGVARTVNAGMTLLYWRIGKRIQADILGNERAEYGKEILATLSQELTSEFGKGFSYSALTRMVRFAENFSEPSIVATLSRQLGWSHFKEIIPLKDELQRDFYAEMCRVERWSVQTLRDKIDSMLYERTAISKKPEKVAKAELANLGEVPADTFFKDQHPDLKADYIMANPPFNLKDWRGPDELVHDGRWNGYETPPTGNANYAWILHMVSKLSENGVAGFVLANGSMSTNTKGEGAIRQKLVENDLVDCVENQAYPLAA